VPDPIRRTAARVLPVSPDGACLLLQDQDPAHPGVLRWGTIGGAVDDGETLPEAAVRELREETGIVVEVDDLTEPFLESSYDFSWAGTAYRSDATFFGLALDRDARVTFDLLEPAEVGNVVAARWWHPEELAQGGGAISNEVPSIMASGVRAVLGEAR
jgi:8-oxo-dGTP pyrophosphatase MutT (NUDIX family)